MGASHLMEWLGYYTPYASRLVYSSSEEILFPIGKARRQNGRRIDVHIIIGSEFKTAYISMAVKQCLRRSCITDMERQLLLSSGYFKGIKTPRENWHPPS